MMCMDVHCEDGDEDIIVYGDQGVSTKEHDKTMYDKLTKTKVKKKTHLTIMWPYVMIACHWRRKDGDLMRICPTKMYMM